MHEQAQPELLNFGTGPDLLWNGVAHIDRMSGGLFRFVGYVEERVNGRVRWVRAGSLILPFVAVPNVCRLTAEALSDETMRPADGWLMAAH